MPTNRNLPKKSKLALLTELESLKYLLQEDDTTDEQNTDMIPILQDAIVETVIENSLLPAKEAPSPPEHATTSTTPADEPATPPDANSPLKQQSLFAQPPVPAAMGSRESLSQNPFLPPSVRQRLGNTPSPSVTETPTINPYDIEPLIDQIIARYLPKIEQELRKEILAALKPANKNKNKNKNKKNSA